MPAESHLTAKLQAETPLDTGPLLTGKSPSGNGRAAVDPGLMRWSGLVKPLWGYAALVRVTVKPSAWICRMWLRSLRSASVRAW